jgi:hypothetical protein
MTFLLIRPVAFLPPVRVNCISALSGCMCGDFWTGRLLLGVKCAVYLLCAKHVRAGYAIGAKKDICFWKADNGCLERATLAMSRYVRDQ